MSLKFRVFLHSYLGFNSNSTLDLRGTGCDSGRRLPALSDTHRMIAEIIPMRKNLTHIYVSHFHPDHHFGLLVLQQAFPQCQDRGAAERGKRYCLYVERQNRTVGDRSVRAG